MTAEMPELAQGIQGWMDFRPYYWRIANSLPSYSILVELGPWLGLSTIFLAQSLDAVGNKGSVINAIDTWKGSPNEQAVFDYVLAGGDGLERFNKAVAENGVEHLIVPIVSDSVEAAKMFPKKSVNFVFFDTEHTEERLSAELQAWMPKMGHGIWFGGHDIAVPGVRAAVQRHVKNWKEVGPCWEAKND